MSTYYRVKEVIAGIATPPGEGGIAIIRISGTDAPTIANRIFSGDIHSYASHTVHLGRILDLEGRTIDRGLVVVMREPKSYTGENMVEFHCHGGSWISRKVLQELLKAGARGALPGEFTFRSFRHGKMDLTQAEAVQQLIGAKSARAWEIATNQLEGRLGKKIEAWQQRIRGIGAFFTAWVDFPEEGLEFEEEERRVGEQIDRILLDMKELLATFHEGKKVQEGVSLCLFGEPNVGKSSLMNALLHWDRAIVTSIAGTTRDLLEEELKLGAISFVLVDTAGIRDGGEEIEREGVKRSLERAKKADLLLFVLDVTRPLPEDLLHLDFLQKDQTIIVWNKTDLCGVQEKLPSFPYQVEVSAKEKRGFEKLKHMIEELCLQNHVSREEVVLVSERHFQSIQAALLAMQRIRKGVREGVSFEFLAVDIREALSALDLVVGTNVTEDLLTTLFAKFCVGK